jgi:two-component system response regulator TctD
MKLLLIEDNPAMQTTLQRSFERRGMQVDLCGDGARRWTAGAPAARRGAAGPEPARLDGLQVLAAARAEGLQTPVLILTARGTVGDRVLGLNTGADDYLAKPFDLDELEARVRALAPPPASGSAADPGAARGRFCGLRWTTATAARSTCTARCWT